MFVARSLVTKVSHSGEDHRHSEPVCRSNHLVVSDGTTRLHDCGRASSDRGLEAIGKRKERITRQRGARQIESYPAGRVVFYSQGSTHRPLSTDGAKILYIPFDGILFGKDPEDLARKMVKVGTAAEALEYALHWMVPDAGRRREIQDALANHSS